MTDELKEKRMNEEWDAIVIDRDGNTRVKLTPTCCRTCGSPNIPSADAPYCDACVSAMSAREPYVQGSPDIDTDTMVLARLDELALAASNADDSDAYRHAQKAYHYVWTTITDLFGMAYAESVKANAR